MPLKPQDSDFEEFPIPGKRVYLDDLESLASILQKLGQVIVEVTQSNGTRSEVDDLTDIYGRDIDYVKLIARVPDQSRILGYLDVATVDLGGSWFNHASIDKRKPDAIAAVRHLASTLDTYRPPWRWRLLHPGSGAPEWVEIITEPRKEAKASGQSRAHDMRVMVLGALLGAVLTIAASLLINLLS